MTPEQQFRLAGFLSDELGLAIELAEVTRLGTGRSRAMYRLTTTHGLRLVARVEQGGLFGTRTVDEVTGTRGLRSAGVPVAEVVAVDEAGHVLGHPMFVMEFVDGIDTTPTPPPVLDDFIVQIDRMHHLRDTDLLGLSARDEVDVWLERASVVEPSPLLIEVAAWLRANRPAHAIATAPIHGDAGPGNFVHDGERVLIITDWEFAHLGDPAEDWVYIAKEKGAGEMSPAAWRRRIGELTGWGVTDDEWDYWDALNLFKGVCANVTALPIFDHGITSTPDMLTVGTAMYHDHLRRVVDIVHAKLPR
jgi:aminoglycoside phosphotransferase (APT) family kinase protein